MTIRSLVIPVYRNEANIPALADAVSEMAARWNNDLEVVFVIDGSPDNSGAALETTAKQFQFPWVIVYHSRNFGAFQAVRTGLQRAHGKYVAVMAADLQEPPELVVSMFQMLSSNGADVVFGKRTKRSDGAISSLLSNTYWGLYRRFVVKDIPSGGIDVFACNRSVLDSLLAIEEPNGSLISQLFWVGYRRCFIEYERQPRVAGKSAWSFRKRFQYMLDSIFSYTDLPILVVLWSGAIGSIVSVVLGLATIIGRISGTIEESGYATLLVIILFFGSAILLVQGVLGCYIWRIAENSKRRPMSIVSSEKSADALT